MLSAKAEDKKQRKGKQHINKVESSAKAENPEIQNRGLIIWYTNADSLTNKMAELIELINQSTV